ncbi:MAG TPA: hypothetical protein VGQ71_03030 [Terriglobales bacterium]|jgi:hypothetical protein|nr:hypothetical protein [Terriglobales bacterium]
MKVRLASVVLLMLLWAAPALGQGCAMCSTATQAASQSSQRAMRRAVTILMVPSVTLLAGFVGIAFWYRRRDE